MGVRKARFIILAVCFLSGAAVAAIGNVPTSVTQPVPMQPEAPAAPYTLNKHPKVKLVQAQVKPAATIASAATTPATTTAKPTQTYADSTPGQTTGIDVNTDIPYTSMLPKDAEIVAGAPGKNEFFIVAAEDAAKIKQLVDHTKPGGDVAVGNIKSKQSIIKVKLDESNSTLVSMDVVSSMKEVAQDAVKPSLKMTAEDEVLSIFTKNKITPIGSRAVTPGKAKRVADETDNKPMLKLMSAMNDGPVLPAATRMTQGQPPVRIPMRVPVSPAGAIQAALPANNPLTLSASVKPPVNVVMPDKVAAKQTLVQVQRPERPVEKPVALPPVSKEAAPTLEMVLQQSAKPKSVKFAANNEPLKKSSVLNKPVAEKKQPVKVATVKKPEAKPIALKTKKVEKKSVAIKKFPVKTVVMKKAVVKPIKVIARKKSMTSVKTVAVKKAPAKTVAYKKVVAARKVIAYEDIAPNHKKLPWRAKHAADKHSVAVAKPKKRSITPSATHNYADYTKKKTEPEEEPFINY